MDGYRMEREAKDRWKPDGPKLKFKLVGPIGELEAWWEDPYFGMFHIKDRGLFMVKQFDTAYPPIEFEWDDNEAVNETAEGAKS